MGGVDPARGHLARAIEAGKQVVTANKMLLALHGGELLERAQEARRRPRVRGRRRRRHPGHSRAARGARERLDREPLGHRQRHLQLHPHAHARGRALVRGGAEGGAGEGLRRGRSRASTSTATTPRTSSSSSRCSRSARASTARSIPTEGIRGVEPVDHAFAERFGYVVKHLAIAKDKGGARAVRSSCACTPRSSRRTRRSPTSTACSTRSRSKGARSDRACSRAAARATCRPR